MEACAAGNKKPVYLEFKYTGLSCNGAINSQVKDECEQFSPNMELPEVVRIVAKSKKGVIIHDAIVKQNALITFTGADQDIVMDDVTKTKKGKNEDKSKSKKKNGFGSEIMIMIMKDSEVLQTIAIHTSCSDPLIKGDQFGGLELIYASATLLALEDPGPGTCDLDVLSDPCEELEKDFTALTFIYSQTKCQVPFSQPQNKGSCNDIQDITSAFGEKVSIIAFQDKKDLVVTPAGNVGPGDAVTIGHPDGFKGNEITVEIQTTEDEPKLVQKLRIHISCSAPLFAQFGSLKHTEITDANGETRSRLSEVELQYSVKNPNQVPIKAQINQITRQPCADKEQSLDVEVDVEEGGTTTITLNISVDQFLGGLVYTVATMETKTTGGSKCGESESSFEFTINRPTSCESGGSKSLKPGTITFRYTGGGCEDQDHDQEVECTATNGMSFAEVDQDPALIEVQDKKGNVLFSDYVEIGATFDVPKPQEGGETGFELTPDIYLSSGSIEALKIHTSCSKPLQVGNQFAFVTVEGWVSKSGRLIGNPSSVPDDCVQA